MKFLKIANLLNSIILETFDVVNKATHVFNLSKTVLSNIDGAPKGKAG